jgi:CRP/FNR family transcriptional regulator, cyclic AMP receptor protein
MEKAAAVSLLHQEPSFSERFTAHLLSRNIEIEEDLVDQLALQPRTAEEE